ncbi:DUF1289 domain-containing protein [Massilia sp. erpn]|uniref:DUF1289 domain-containing protein n=1 Tax=Massilia sp. erpn TaxID=2738142 RepID=UPI0027D99CC4|nr:DUF1289 domain-containing protein [Massilia sp. erpn]
MQANSGRTPKMQTQDKIRLIFPTTAPMSHHLPPGALELATPVPSPCISLCKMNRDSGFCEGCLRTIDEIVAWSQADDAFKRGVWAEIRRREQLIDFE